MNYYEVEEPYYALIRAENKDVAMKEYVDVIAENDDGELSENMKEVQSDYAIAKFSRAKGEDGQEVPLHEVLQSVRSGESAVVLIFDANLA